MDRVVLSRINKPLYGLKDYVSQTIVQISEGVIDAMNKLEGKGVIINPNSKSHSDGQFWIGMNKEYGPVER